MFIHYPHIDQYRQVVSDIIQRSQYIGRNSDGEPIYCTEQPKPKVEFTASIKIHGTNAAVTLTKNGELEMQRRSSLITPDQDNYGFATWVLENEKSFRFMLSPLLQYFINEVDCDQVTLFGEFAGKGIQSKVAVSDLPKMFYIFDFAVSKNNSDGLADVLFADDIPQGLHLLRGLPEVDGVIINLAARSPEYQNKPFIVDTEQPHLFLDAITPIVDGIGAECPVAKELGAGGFGEGLVFTGAYQGKVYRFKIKDSRHKVSKIREVAAVDEVELASLQEFVELTCTEIRLKQGLELIASNTPLDIKNMGSYIKWVVQDILREESDLIQTKQIDTKKATKLISTKAREYFQASIN